MKAHVRLNWHQILPLEQAIQETSNWYKSYFNNVNILDFSIGQLAAYEDWMEA